MDSNLRDRAEPPETSRARRIQVVRAVRDRPQFRSREAQAVLRRMERHWAPIAYGIFVLALVVIGSVAYTSYAFSRYRGVILPGVHVDNTSLSNLTPTKASRRITDRLNAIYFVPISLTDGTRTWKPNRTQIGLKYRVNDTVAEAMDVGRTGSIVGQLIDRLPLHPDHGIPLLYTLDSRQLKQYIQTKMVNPVSRPPHDARLKVSDGRVELIPSIPGRRLDASATLAIVQNALGSLSRQTKPVPVTTARPLITDAYASGIERRVNRFLARTPVIGVGKRVIPTTRASIAAAISFTNRDHTGHGQAAIVMTVNQAVVQSYVAGIASTVDSAAHNAQINFNGKNIQVVSPQRNGRSLNQSAATAALVKAIQSLQPGKRLRFKVQVVKPPIDQTNPASLGIRTLLGAGATTFPGAPPARLNGIIAITRVLNEILISPNQYISFNTLVGTDWQDSVYRDQEVMRSGKIVPSGSGAMQQVATTFFRALYGAGLKPLEYHPHPYLLPWYTSPVGLDAVVFPATGDDLRFLNNTGHYLLITTRVEPIRQEVYIYVYGPKLGWRVSVNPVGRVVSTTPHGPPVVRQDPALASGQVKQIAWAHDGATTVVTRTIAFPNGDVKEDEIRETFQPWRSVILEGPNTTVKPKKTPSPRSTGTPGATPTPPPTPRPSPTATFNH